MAERARREAHASRVSQAKQDHYVAMDAAVHLAKMRSQEVALSWVRAHVDEQASEMLSSVMGSEGYHRYLCGLWSRFTKPI
jgi:hypothetical protein